MSVLSADHALNLLLQTDDNVVTIDRFEMQYRNRRGRIPFEADSAYGGLVSE